MNSPEGVRSGVHVTFGLLFRPKLYTNIEHPPYRLIHFVTANDFHDLHWNTYVVESRKFAKYEGHRMSIPEDSKSDILIDSEHSLAKVFDMK